MHPLEHAEQSPPQIALPHGNIEQHHSPRTIPAAPPAFDGIPAAEREFPSTVGEAHDTSHVLRRMPFN